MKSLTPRSWILGALALLLAGILALREGSGGDTAPRSAEAIKARIETLRRTLAGRDDLAARYGELAGLAGERLAGLETYDPARRPDARAIEKLVRSKLGDPGSLLDVSIAPAGSEELGDGITRLVFDISFSTLSSRQAGDAVSAFARPETGLAWETLSVSADKREQKLTVAGKLAALLIGPVE